MDISQKTKYDLLLNPGFHIDLLCVHQTPVKNSPVEVPDRPAYASTYRQTKKTYFTVEVVRFLLRSDGRPQLFRLCVGGFGRTYVEGILQ